MHEVLVTNEGEAVRGCPNYVRSMPNSKKDYEGIEPCAVGSTVEVRTLSLSKIDAVVGSRGRLSSVRSQFYFPCRVINSRAMQ